MESELLSPQEAAEYAREFFNRNLLLEHVQHMKAKELADPEIEAKAAAETYERMKTKAECPANTDTNDHDALVKMAALFLRTGERLPPWLAKFAADVLEGERTRPTKRGKDAYANWERDFKLYMTALEVSERFNLPLYTNNELSSKTTAADVTAEAAQVGIDVVKNSIKKFEKKTKTGAK